MTERTRSVFSFLRRRAWEVWCWVQMLGFGLYFAWCGRWYGLLGAMFAAWAVVAIGLRLHLDRLETTR